MTRARRYAGQTAEERRKDRHDRLVQAALEVFGTTGFESSSIERLCSQASVSTRYFYEEFPSREALLQAVYDDVLRSATLAGMLAMQDDQLSAVQRIAAGVRAYVLVLTSDPRRTRVVHLEARVVPSMAGRRRESALWTSELIRQRAGAAPDPTGAPFVPGLVLLGAVSEVLADWAGTSEPRPPVGPIVAELCAFATDAVGGYLTSEP